MLRMRVGEHLHGEGLGDHRHARLEKAVRDGGVLRVAGHEQHLQVRPPLARGVGHLPAVQARQADVGDQQVDALARAQHLQAGRPVGRLQRAIAEVAQHLDHEAAHDRLVLDHEHGLALLGLVRFRQRRHRPVLGGLAAVAGQVELHGRALAHLAVDLAVAIGLPGEAVDHRQAKPRALADRLGGEERVEGALDHLGRHAGTGVGDADADVLAGTHAARVGSVGAVEVCVAGLDGERATVGHGVAGIDDQVEDRALELVGVAQREP